MENAILILILVVIVLLTLRPALKHFRGQGGGCCGGGDYKPRQKKLSHVRYTKTFHVEGMHCDHCKNRVEEAIGDLPGVAARVDLKAGTVTVSYAQDVPDEAIAARVKRFGYTLK